MSGIFISYRRDDTAADMTDRLYEQLVRRWGRSVFMDIDSLAGGDLFAQEIDKHLQQCSVVLVMIGREWLSLRDASGRRRVDDPADYPRLEVAAALRRGIRVIPVLVGQAVLPRAEELPQDIAGLAQRQAIRLARERFDADVRKVLAAVAAAMPARWWRAGKLPRAAVVLVMAALGAAIGLYLLQRDEAQDTQAADTRPVATVAPTAQPASAAAASPAASAPGAEARAPKTDVNVSGVWTTAIVKSPYSATVEYRLRFEITQLDDALSGTVTEIGSTYESTSPITEGRIKNGVLSFHTTGEVSAGPGGSNVPFKQRYIGEVVSGKRQIAFKRFNDVATGGVVQRFVAARQQ